MLNTYEKELAETLEFKTRMQEANLDKYLDKILINFTDTPIINSSRLAGVNVIL